MLLGSLLTDIPGAETYQLRREPAGWGWAERASKLNLKVAEPIDFRGPPALAISMSATILPERILRLQSDASIWQLSAATPHNDILRSRSQLAEFRGVVRLLLDRIKAVHGQRAVVSIFPAMPVAAAVEFGRVRMPKADLPWKVFDEVAARGGFVEALEIPGDEGAP